VRAAAAGACPGGGDCASEINANASEQRHVMISVFIVEAGVGNRLDLRKGLPLSQMTLARVEQNFSFFSATLPSDVASLNRIISTAGM
jgi:hypothetical protein